MYPLGPAIKVVLRVSLQMLTVTAQQQWVMVGDGGHVGPVRLLETGFV